MNLYDFNDLTPIYEENSEEFIENNLYNNNLEENYFNFEDSDENFRKSDYLQTLQQLKQNISQNSKYQSTDKIQKILDENVNSLQNSISLFYNMYKSQIDDINRIAEEYNFALSQLNRKNALITKNKSKVQSELESIESFHSELAKATSSIHDLHKPIEMDPSEKVQFLYNKFIIKYEKKCQKISNKNRKISHHLKALKAESYRNKNQIQFLRQKQIKLFNRINEIISQMNQIISIKKNYNSKLNALRKTKEIKHQIQFSIKQNKIKKESLHATEQLLLQKLDELKKKEEILNQETREINEVQKLIVQRHEDIKRTSLIQDDVEKPLVLFYNELKDNIQEELQKEIILNRQLFVLKQNENLFKYNSNTDYNNSQINCMKEQLEDLDNSCMLLHEQIFNQNNSKIKLINQIKDIESKLKTQMNDIYKLQTHHNGNVDVLYDYTMNRSDLEYIKKVEQQIQEKKEFLKLRREKYYSKCDSLIAVIENFMAECTLGQ